MGGTWDATNVVRRAGRRRHARSRSTTREYLGHDVERDRGREGRDHQARRRSACSPSSRSRPPRCCSRRAVEVDAIVAREGMEFGVLARPVAVGGQLVRAAGPGRGVRRDLPAAVRRAPGAQRRRRAGRRRGVPRRRRAPTGRARRRPGARGLRGGALAGPARGGAARRRPSCSTPRTTRPGARATADGDHASPSTSPGWSAWSAAWPTRTSRDARGARAGLRRGRRHPERLAAGDARRRAGRARRRRLRRRPGRGRAAAGRRARRGRSRWPRRRATSAARACWSPDRSSRWARPGPCSAARDSPARAAAAPARPGAQVRGIAAAVLVFEALVIVFATLVALDLTDVRRAPLWWVGGVAAAACCLLVAGLLGRPGRLMLAGLGARRSGWCAHAASSCRRCSSSALLLRRALVRRALPRPQGRAPAGRRRGRHRSHPRAAGSASVQP